MEQNQYNQLFSFIWNIATDVLVNSFNKSKYKEIIMPMMVLRRIDVLLEPTKQMLLTQKRMLDDNNISNQDPILFNITGYPFYNTSLFTMKTMKRIAALVLAMLMIAGLVGCGGGKEVPAEAGRISSTSSTFVKW